jgi:hypothetical protein
MHPYLDWTKTRIDEMDATLASIERQFGKMEANTQVKVKGLLTALRNEREAFVENMKKQTLAGEAAFTGAKDNMEAHWNAFEVKLQKYMDDAEKQVEQGRATFQARAEAQIKAWQSLVDKIAEEARDYAVDQRAKIEAAVAPIRADAKAAEARIQKLSDAGTESWFAFKTALAETRAAFDRASQVAHDAIKGAVKATG